MPGTVTPALECTAEREQPNPAAQGNSMTVVPFESIRIHDEVRVIRLDGEAVRLTARKTDRFPLKTGDTLTVGSRLWLAGSSRIDLQGEKDGLITLTAPSGGRTFFLSYLDENDVGHRMMK